MRAWLIWKIDSPPTRRRELVSAVIEPTTSSPSIPSTEKVTVAPEPDVRHSGLRWCLLLVAFLVAYIGFMIRDSYFYADDFLTFGFAHQDGLRWSFAFLNLFGHIAPTERLLNLLVLDIAPFNYAVGETIILILFALVMLSFLWVLRELRVGLAWTLTLLFVVGTSTIVLNETLYYDAAVFLLPASVFVLCVTALFIRWTRTGSSSMLLASWLVFALSFITQERPLVVSFYLVVLRYLVLPYRMAPGGRHRWRSDWRIWLPYAAIGGAYTSYYLTIGSNAHTSTSVVLKFLRLAPGAFLRAVIGIRIDFVGDRSSLLVLLLSIAVLLGLLIFSPRRRLVVRAAVFLAICFAVNVLPVVRGIGGLYGPNIAFELQYYVDALFVLGIAVGIVDSQWLGATASGPGKSILAARHGSHRRPDSVALYGCAAVVVIHLVALPFGISSVRHDNTGQAVARSWISHLQASLTAMDRGRRATVLPLTLPPSFVPGFESPFNYESEFFPELPQWHGYDTGPVEVAGPTGTLLPTSAGDAVALTGPSLAAAIQGQNLAHLTQVSGPPGSVCYQGDAIPGQFELHLPAPVDGHEVAGDLSLTTQGQLTVSPFSVDGTTVTEGEPPVTVPAGERRLLVAFGGSAAAVGFMATTPHAYFCLISVQIGSVLVPSVVKGECDAMDAVGTLYDNPDCGLPWRGPTFPSRVVAG